MFEAESWSVILGGRSLTDKLRVSIPYYCVTYNHNQWTGFKGRELSPVIVISKLSCGLISNCVENRDPVSITNFILRKRRK